jgi:serine/threonine protein kinase
MAGTAASPALPMNAFPKELADKYTQVSPIGSGGFAMVYSAYRVSDGQKVAVKIPIRSNERTGKSFLHEIKVWESMHHPNIVEVKATNILPVPYVEMEFVPGSLENVTKPVPVVTAARIVRGVTEGIRYAHARRCIHRDIKPQNILLTDEMIPKITDWGISKVLEENTRKTTVAGFSLAYAAPEQIAPEKFGSTDERTDIYQIGAVFYELVTGLTPFDDESMMEMVSQIITEDPILPSDIDPDAEGVEKIILRCLAKNKNKRYQSAGELQDALTAYLDTIGWGLFEDAS